MFVTRRATIHNQNSRSNQTCPEREIDILKIDWSTGGETVSILHANEICPKPMSKMRNKWN